MHPSIAFPASAIVLAFMVSAGLGAEPKPGTQVEQSLKVNDDFSVPYLLYLPKEYETKEGNWPLLLFLHGRGESYGPLSLVKKWGPPRLIERGDDLPYVTASPQCPGEERWSDPRQQQGLIKLLDHLSQQFRIDKTRIYLTGLSLGGYGSWRLAADHPERFAAVVPVCGGGDPTDADKLKQLPIWVFHGTEDKAVPFARSVEMVDAIRGAGSTRIRFTSLEGIGHNCWSATYATPDLYIWLSQQETRRETDANSDSK